MMFFKKYAKLLVIGMDLLVLPGIFFCRWLAAFMIGNGKPCSWTLVGAQCGTCGGTRCVSNLLQGNFAEAFALNPFVFAGAVYLAVTAVLLNLYALFGVKWAQKLLLKMYSLRALIVASVLFVLFVLVRNIPFLVGLFEAVSAMLNG